MRQVHTLLKRAVATGALLAAAYAVASVSSAQDATTSTTTATPTTSTAKVKVPPTTATPKMIADAVARSKARYDKFLATGTPEQFGSEEPYTPK
jgi:hypothetical protein